MCCKEREAKRQKTDGDQAASARTDLFYRQFCRIVDFRISKNLHFCRLFRNEENAQAFLVEFATKIVEKNVDFGFGNRHFCRLQIPVKKICARPKEPEKVIPNVPFEACMKQSASWVILRLHSKVVWSVWIIQNLFTYGEVGSALRFVQQCHSEFHDNGRADL